MNLYSRSQIGLKVEAIVAMAKATDSELHVVLCSILDHTREHGDYTAILPLLNGLPNGQRKQGIVAWLKHFSGKKLIAKQGEGRVWECELSKDRQDSDFDIVGAMAITFGDFTAEPVPTTLDVKALLKILEKKATSTETNKDGSPKVSPEAKDFASKLVAAAREMLAA
jgi:hypothetical protein